MSLLEQLAKLARRDPTLKTGADRIEFLSARTFPEDNGLYGRREWDAFMRAMAEHSARQRGVGLDEGWIHAADILRTAYGERENDGTADMDGPAAAAYAWCCGICYASPHEYARLLRGMRSLFAEAEIALHVQDANRVSEERLSPELAFHFSCLNRYGRARKVAAAESRRPHRGAPRGPSMELVGEVSPCPEAFLLGTQLLWEQISSEVSDALGNSYVHIDELSEYVSLEVVDGWRYYWAGHLAHAHQVDLGELALLIIVFDEWELLLYDLVAYGCLGPHVIPTLANIKADPNNIRSQAAKLIATWKRHHRKEMSLGAYLNNAFRAIENGV